MSGCGVTMSSARRPPQTGSPDIGSSGPKVGFGSKVNGSPEPDSTAIRSVLSTGVPGVGQVEPAVADRQPAVGIIDDGDALATEVAGDRVRLQQEYDLVVLQGQAVGNRPLFAPGEDVGEIIAG